MMKRKETRRETPRVWLRIDKAHVEKVIKARRALCVGEGVRR
jgi:hypothetical protein